MITDLENAVGFARDTEITAFDHLPIDVFIEGVLVIFETLLSTTPEPCEEAERQRPRLAVSVVIEQIVVQQRHRLHVRAVHDVVFGYRVVLLEVARGQVRIEGGATAAGVLPLNPHFRMQDLRNRFFE